MSATSTTEESKVFAIRERIQKVQTDYLDNVEKQHGKKMRLCVTMAAKSLGMLETIPAAINMSADQASLHAVLEPILGQYFGMVLSITMELAELSDKQSVTVREMGEHLVVTLNQQAKELLGGTDRQQPPGPSTH